MRRFASLLTVLFLLFAAVPCVNAQFDDEETPPSGDPGDVFLGQDPLKLCLLPTSDNRCQHVFGPAGESGSCGGATCSASSPCSPTSVIRFNPKWNNFTATRYRNAYVDEVGFSLTPKGVNCEVIQQCGCQWDADALGNICKLTSSWTVLQSYMTAPYDQSSPSCQGTAPR